MTDKVEHVTKGSIYDDETLAFPLEHRIKAKLVDEIAQRITTDRLTQVLAAERMGIAQPDFSNILRGKFRGYSIDRLTTMLGRLGYSIDIVLRSPTNGEPDRTVHMNP